MPVIHDVNRLRAAMLPLVYGVDEAFTIYYDETNNIRKLYLTDDGFNTERQDHFVLGGRSFATRPVHRRHWRIAEQAPNPTQRPGDEVKASQRRSGFRVLVEIPETRRLSNLAHGARYLRSLLRQP